MGWGMTLANLLSLWPDIFDNINLPTNIDKETCVYAIVDKCENHVMIYIDYPYVKHKIERWFRVHYEQFYRLAYTIEQEYDLLDNYERTREYSRKNENTTFFGRSYPDLQ